MGNEVPVSVPGLPDDQLGVEHDEATEDSQTDPNVCLNSLRLESERYWKHYRSDLEEELRPEEDVDEAQPDEGGEPRAEHPGQVEILPVRGHQRGSSEAGKDCGGHQECSGDDARVHRDGHLEERSHAKSSQKSEAHQHGHSGSSVLAIVRSHEETNGQPGSQQGVEEAAASEEVGAEVDVGPGCGGQHRHGEAGVNILQVTSHRRLAGNEEMFTSTNHKRAQ